MKFVDPLGTNTFYSDGEWAGGGDYLKCLSNFISSLSKSYKAKIRYMSSPGGAHVFKFDEVAQGEEGTITYGTTECGEAFGGTYGTFYDGDSLSKLDIDAGTKGGSIGETLVHEVFHAKECEQAAGTPVWDFSEFPPVKNDPAAPEGPGWGPAVDFTNEVLEQTGFKSWSDLMDAAHDKDKGGCKKPTKKKGFVARFTSKVENLIIKKL